MKKLWKVMATLCVLATALLLSGCSNGSSEPYTGDYFDLYWINDMTIDDYTTKYNVDRDNDGKITFDDCIEYLSNQTDYTFETFFRLTDTEVCQNLKNHHCTDETVERLKSFLNDHTLSAGIREYAVGWIEGIPTTPVDILYIERIYE